MEKLYTYSKNKMKMIINTGFKEFDKQTNYIGHGNVIANTQYSNYIRAYNETINPVGQEVEKGYLQKYDLQFFSDINQAIRKELTENKDMKFILYEFRIYRNGRKRVIGHILTDTENNTIIKSVLTYRNESYYKRYSALNLCEKIIQSRG